MTYKKQRSVIAQKLQLQLLSYFLYKKNAYYYYLSYYHNCNIFYWILFVIFF